MIRKVINLTQNETTKQFKKLNIKVIIALILIFSVTLPILINYINNKENNFMIENYKHNLNYIESRISELSKEDKTENKIEKQFLEAEKQVMKINIDNNINYNDWRSVETDALLGKLSKIVVVDNIIGGVDKKTISNNMHYLSNEDVEVYFTLSNEELKKEKDKLVKEKEDLTKSIVSNDYMAYLSKAVTNQEAVIKESNKEILEYEKALEKNKDDKNLVEKINLAKLAFNTEKSILEMDKYRLKNRIPYDDKEWRHNTLQGMINSVHELSQPMLSEEDYKRESGNYGHLGKTYEDYKDIYNKNKVKNEKNIKLGWYSLENNIPQISNSYDARSIVDNTYEIFVMITAILSIIIAGGIVSSEFSKGTVRLLLIRPVSRVKILLSKLISVFLIGYGVLFLSIILLTISSGFILGFDTLSTSVLKVVEGSVVEGNYFMYMLPKLLLSSVSIIFVIAMSFMISTVAKNTALSVGLSSILFLGSMPITMILANFKLAAITKFVIAYANLSIFNLMPFFQETIRTQYGVTLDVNIGAIQLAVLSIIFIVVSFISFMKSDVKN